MVGFGDFENICMDLHNLHHMKEEVSFGASSNIPEREKKQLTTVVGAYTSWNHCYRRWRHLA